MVNRIIKFRALASANDKHSGIKKGNMVFGQFIRSGIDAPCIVSADGEQIEVDRKTLGQLIGCSDRKGVDVYEGDILYGKYGDAIEVCFSSMSFCAVPILKKERYRHYPLDEIIMRDYEVIGNIHKNQELLLEYR